MDSSKQQTGALASKSPYNRTQGRTIDWHKALCITQTQASTNMVWWLEPRSLCASCGFGSCFSSWSHRTSAVSHNSLYWHEGFFTWSAGFYHSRNIGAVMYPKQRLAPQNTRFSHTGWKPVAVVLSPSLWCWTLSRDGRIISFTVKTRGGLCRC